jgi:hypothetical protein
MTQRGMQLLLISMVAFIALLRADDNINIRIIQQKHECEHAMNIVRGNHLVKRLTWDDKLAFGAEEWALSLALRRKTEIDKSHKIGEAVYRFRGFYNSGPVSCAKAIYKWYEGIKNFNYNNPKYEWKCGEFIQIVYDADYKFGIGIAHHEGHTYIVGRFSMAINPYSNFKKHIKPFQNPLTLQDLTMAKPPKKNILNVKVPKNSGFTEYMQTGQCSVKCGEGSVSMQRYCVRKTKYSSPHCASTRTKTSNCQGTDCPPKSGCKDIHKDCSTYAGEKKYCKNDKYGDWMKKSIVKTINMEIG